MTGTWQGCSASQGHRRFAKGYWVYEEGDLTAPTFLAQACPASVSKGIYILLN